MGILKNNDAISYYELNAITIDDNGQVECDLGDDNHVLKAKIANKPGLMIIPPKPTSNKNEKIEKRAFILLAILEKTLQTSKARNNELAKYLNHKSNQTPLQQSKGFQHKLISSYTIAHNSGLEKKNILHQVRLFLIEIKEN